MFFFFFFSFKIYDFLIYIIPGNCSGISRGTKNKKTKKKVIVVDYFNGN